ncbi:cytochrome P450 89A2-like [Malania oleifera]|uniref:cytochrome P450 89A2-like n=1 Tax=Malania oleifera TaxID=397392 RepID=UPI0025AE2949|nr:cytochrome P450 89A2-like [Malania oleifera]
MFYMLLLAGTPSSSIDQKMETWFIIIVSLCIAALFKSLFNLLSPTNPKPSKIKGKLPPGPSSTIPIIGDFLWLGISYPEVVSILRNLHTKYGPLVSLRFGSRLTIFIANHSLAHQALIQNGVVFANRPAATPVGRIFSSNQHNVSTAAYGPVWRLLRRNLTSEILHHSRVKSYSQTRKRVLCNLVNLLKTNQSQKLGEPVPVMDHFKSAMFSLLSFMCFGEELGEKKIRDIEDVQRQILLSSERFNNINILNVWSRLGKILFRSRWKELMQIRKSQEDVLIPLIRARMKPKLEAQRKNMQDGEGKNESVLSYVDTFIDLQLPDEKRKLNEAEMVSLCSEFLNGGADTTSTALLWIMANLVKYPHIQEKLFAEINGVVGELGGGGGPEEVKEEDLQKMPYLKAVILEGLRRHPPGHLLVPHTVTEDVTLDDYVVPKNTVVHFMVANIGWDPKVWEDPMAFKPERFLSTGGDGGELFDITGSREIKMMPFGAGRRMCPGSGLAMLHLEYFVANLVWHFEWKAVDGDEVDLSEKQEFTVVMKNPLQARLSPRLK